MGHWQEADRLLTPCQFQSSIVSSFFTHILECVQEKTEFQFLLPRYSKNVPNIAEIFVAKKLKW